MRAAAVRSAEVWAAGVRASGVVPLVEVVRSGVVESIHHGAVLVVGVDGPLHAGGDVDVPILPRSANKPLQAVGMVRAGLRPGPAGLAIAAASHSGEPGHVEEVRALLAGGGLTEDDLGCPPTLPSGEVAARDVLAAGGGPARVTMNCSGKHAAMLRTCRAAGWPIAGYPAADHPLQGALRSTVRDLTGEPAPAAAVDFCGAPVFAVSLRGLAGAYRRLVDAAPGSAERAVADAMRGRPDLVGGTGRPVTGLMAGVPGLLVKDGAEGVLVAALPGVGAVAVKIADGANRAAVPVLVAGLRMLGARGDVLDALAGTPVHGGGAEVGAVRLLAGAVPVRPG